MQRLDWLEDGLIHEYEGALYGSVRFEKDLLLEKNGGGTMPVFDVKTVIVAAFPYMSGNVFGGNLSAYASVKDYHIVVKNHLSELCKRLSEQKKGSFACYTDVSPLNEVKAAAKAGLGVFGENGLLITEKYGSYVFIGEILTDVVFEKTTEKESIAGCIKCGKCRQNCLVKMDKERCISHISQKRGELSETEKALLRAAGTAWGCDMCQRVCPMNKNARETGMADFLCDIKTTVTAQEITETNKLFAEKYKDRAFNWRGRAVLKRNIELLNEAERTQ